MMNKVLVFAVGTLFSLSASAGYVQYDLSYGAANSGLSGFIVQHDTDQSIASFSFNLNDSSARYGQQFFPFFGEGEVLLVDASTYFGDGGPTNFTIYDNFGLDHETSLRVIFARTAGGDFTYTADYIADLSENVPPATYSGTLSGLAVRGTVAPALVNYLDTNGGYDFGVPRIVPQLIAPNQVPEPASLALLAFGAAGIAATHRRKRANS